MARINTIFPSIDEHLRQARMDYPEIALQVIQLVSNKKMHRFKLVPSEYTIRTADNCLGGHGHMMFFYDKLAYVYHQYQAIRAECSRRGFVGGDSQNVDRWPLGTPDNVIGTNGEVVTLWNDYHPDSRAIDLCKKRLIEKIPRKPHFCGQQISRAQAVSLITDGYFDNE